jgi:hypothetical protein
MRSGPGRVEKGGRVVASMLCLLASLLAGSLARAQSQNPPSENPPSQSPPKAPPKPRNDAPPPNQFSLTGALGERATSNPRGETDASSPEGDYVSDLRLDLSVSRRSERTDWKLGYQPFYTQYRESNDLDTTNHTFDFDGRYDLSRRMKLSLSQHGNYSRNPLYVARFETGNAPIVTSETKRWSSVSSLNLATNLSRNLTLNAGATFGLTRFEDPTFYDSQSYSANAGISKALSRDQTISVNYTYSHFFLTAPQLPDLTTDGHGIQGGWAYAVTGKTSIGVSLAAVQVTQGPFQQTVYTGDASYHHVFRPLDVSVGYRQGLSADLGVAEINLSRDSYAAFAGRLGRSAHWGLVGNYGTRTSALHEGGRQDITYMGGALRGDVGFGERLGLTGEASWRRQDNAGETGASGQIPSGVVTVNWLFLGLVFKIF